MQYEQNLLPWGFTKLLCATILHQSEFQILMILHKILYWGFYILNNNDFTIYNQDIIVKILFNILNNR